MAKKKREASEDLLSAFRAAGQFKDSPDENSLDALKEKALALIPEEERDNFMTMLWLAMNGVTPEDYASFYQLFEVSGSIVEQMNSGVDVHPEDVIHPLGGFMNKRKNVIKGYETLEDAEEYTLILKIQMKDVTKPPMWREVEVPADYDFEQLHEIIQAVTGLDDYHLWQFNKNAYDDSLQIGVDHDEFDRGLDMLTHKAYDTFLTQFLQKKGDKLEYVYDFGDDWIFIVEVKDIVRKKIENPVCTKFKSELNALEDFGGIYRYAMAREILESWDSLSTKEKKKKSTDMGFSSSREFIDFLKENIFNLEDVNENLEYI